MLEYLVAKYSFKCWKCRKPLVAFLSYDVRVNGPQLEVTAEVECPYCESVHTVRASASEAMIIVKVDDIRRKPTREEIMGEYA